MKTRLLVLLAMALAVGAAIGQTESTLRVGVVAGRSMGLPQAPLFPNFTNNDRWQAQMLANYLNSRKPNRAGAPKVEAITLTTLDWNGILREARDRGCVYLVVLEVSGETAAQALGSGERRMAEPGIATAPAGAFYSILKASDGEPLPNMPGFVDAPVDQVAQASATRVYTALQKAVHP